MEHNIKIKFCHKCLKELSDSRYGDFCDFECCKSYSAELKNDLSQIYQHVKGN